MKQIKLNSSIKKSSIKEYSLRIKKVAHYINENYDKKLTLALLSEISCFSQFHFHRLFTAFLDETPANFINRIRLEKSAYYLTYFEDQSITEIAFKCGFDSSSSFSRAFKKHFNISASQWREKNSKICQTESNIGKEYGSGTKYISHHNKIKNIHLEEDVEINIKNMPAMHLAYAAHLEGYNDGIAEAYDKLCTWAAPKGLLAGDVKFVGISWDDPDITPANKCRFYACMTVPQNTETGGEINLYDLPATTCIVAKLEGPAEKIKETYDIIYKQYLPSSGYQPDDIPCFEIYYKDPDEDPAGIFDMDICVPVKAL